MEWLYACRGCGSIVRSFHALNAAGEHGFCKTSLVNCDADLTDFVEVGFTVSKAVRKSRFHDPESLSAKEPLSTTTYLPVCGELPILGKSVIRCAQLELSAGWSLREPANDGRNLS
jgi:hypothetical protein